MDIFVHWDKVVLQKLYWKFKSKKVSYGKYIFKSGEKAEEMYIIKSGLVQISTSY